MYRIPLENEQITKALTTPYAPVNYTDAEKEQIVDNIFPSGGNVITDEFISKISTGGVLAKIKKLTGKSVVQNNAIVDAAIKGFGSTGVNIWDEVVEVGRINNATGQNESNNEQLRSKNYAPVMPNTTYKYITTRGGNFYFYDENKAYISYVYTNINETFTTPDNARYIRFIVGSAYGIAYKNNIAIGIGLTKYVPSNPYHRNFPIVLRSAGNVADEVEDTGNGYKVTRRVGTVTYDGTESWSATTSYVYSTKTVPIGANISRTVGQTTSSYWHKWDSDGDGFGWQDAARTRFQFNGVSQFVSSNTDANGWKTYLTTHPLTINYELATPIVEYHPYNLTYPVTENGTEYFDSPISVPCEIEYGIDVINDIVSGVVGGDTERDNGSYDLLWENASPESSFEPQTISLDLSKYSFVLIYFKIGSKLYIAEKTVPIGGTSTVYFASYSTTNLARIFLRDFDVNSNGIYLYFARDFVNGSAYITDNHFLVPVRIYGIK